MAFDPGLLLQASFKGVAFHTKSAAPSDGRRLADHEYPNSEEWYVEDLGIKTPKHSVTAYVSTDCEPQDAYDQATELREACRSPGPGPLILPPDIFVGAHCSECRRSFEKDVQGYITFSIEFTEENDSGAAPFEVGLAVRLISSAMSDAVSIISDLAGAVVNSLGPSPDTLGAAGSIVRSVLATFDDVTKSAGVVEDQGTSVDLALTRALGAVTIFEDSGEASFLSPPSTTIVQPEMMLPAGAPPQRSNQAIGFANMIAFIAPYMQLAANSAADSTQFASTLQDSIITIADDPTPNLGQAVYVGRVAPTAFSVARSAMVQVCGDSVKILAGIAMCQAYADATYATRMDAQAARGLMVATVDEVVSAIDMSVYGDHSGIEQLLQARDAASSAIQGIIATMENTVQMTLNEPMPALYLAWRIYQDPHRAQELADRNNAPHPNFMPLSFEATAP